MIEANSLRTLASRLKTDLKISIELAEQIKDFA
jgi:hypothetical protein